MMYYGYMMLFAILSNVFCDVKILSYALIFTSYSSKGSAQPAGT